MKKALLLAPMSSVHERFNVANIEALKNLNYEIHLAGNFEISEHDLEYKNSQQENGIIIHQMPIVRGSLIKNLKIIPQIRRLLGSEKFDIVHCHTETGGVLTRISMGAAKKTKYVYTPHGMSFYKGCSLKSRLIYYPIEKWICRAMSANLAMNGEELTVLKKWNENTAKFIHGIGLDLTKVQDNEVNTEAKRKEFDVPIDAKLVLSVGELNDNKNHEVIIKAISKLANQNIYYMICGEGEKEAYLKSLANELGLGDRFILTGYRYDVKEIYKISDIFAFPSFHEGLSVSLMEAMASGLPIVCSKIRGNVDLIKETEGGFLCEPTDVDGFVNSLGKILFCEELQQSIKNCNLKTIKDFSFETVVKETEEIYRNVI